MNNKALNRRNRGTYSEQLQCIIAALKQLPERRFTATTYILVYRLESFECAGELTRLDYADEHFAQAEACFEERSMRRYPFGPL